TAVNELQRHITPLTTCVGLLALDADKTLDCRMFIQNLPVPCAGMAFVTGIRLRKHRRLAVDLSLSRHYACPCRIFENEPWAQLWLQGRIETFLW
ncbi:MAG: hypothetical protein ACOCX5_03845, partial [Chloroflexota bacterium]